MCQPFNPEKSNVFYVFSISNLRKQLAMLKQNSTNDQNLMIYVIKNCTSQEIDGFSNFVD